MDNITRFMNTNIGFIITFIAIILVVVYIVMSPNKKKIIGDVSKTLKLLIYTWVKKAQAEYDTPAGQDIKNHVLTFVFNSEYFKLLPNFIKSYLSSDVVGKWIDEVINEYFTDVEKLTAPSPTDDATIHAIALKVAQSIGGGQ